MLTQQQVQQLKMEGYSDREIADAVEEVEREQRLKQGYSNVKGQGFDSRTMSQQTAFSSYTPQDNMIKWQLEVNEILERTEHILREDEISYEQGHIIWKPTLRTDKVLNEYGVREIMRILSMYVNRNTILGFYTAEEVYDKVFDFGDRLNSLLYTKYEIMGMDTEEKRKNFEMIFGMLVDVVHSSYSRAIGGGERKSLRESHQFQQLEQLGGNAGGGNVINVGQGQQQKRSIFNPMRYIAGKYKS